MNAAQDPADGPGLAAWERAGLAATLVLVVAIPLAFLKWAVSEAPRTVEEKATYVGREACKDCHRKAYDAWTGSDHDLAMQEANESTVLADFNDATFEQFGVVSRFYRKDGGFWVRTEGPDGAMGDFQVAYTFGVRPLQQYLIRFPGGRLQCLTIAWDVARRRWYSLYPDRRIPPGDWLHWTRGAQNWNGMCSECHSTHVHKGYDPDTDTYDTTWSEIDVSCEACHGPGSLHVAWARIPPMARPNSDDYRLVISTRGMSAREQVELCAPCHSRRFLLHDYEHAPGTDVLDHLVPSLLEENLYFPDGQIRDEVYVYASFLQSKMYRHGVRCTDCHDPHTTKRHKDGNDLCLQCHRGDVYNTSEHHFHKPTWEGKPSPGWLCQNCHMPQRVYMGIDWRADHSLRVPRPDLSLTLGTPNACSVPACHGDKPVAWAAQWTAKWYGQARPRHYGSTIAAAREGRPGARDDLIRLTQDRLYPAIVRATAVSLLDRYDGPETRQVLIRALGDEESLVRWAAVDHAPMLAPEERLGRLAPLLADPVEAVRAQAARMLGEIGAANLKERDAAAFRTALAEYERSMRYTADFPSSGYNLGNLYAAMGRPQDAEREYERSLRIDPLFVRSRVNYSLLLSATGRNGEAEQQLRAALAAEPDLPEANYNLGLLLAETGKLDEAAQVLGKAARERPDFPRVHYNLGLLLSQLGRTADAERSLARALALEPDNADYLFAMTDLHLRRGDRAAAEADLKAWAAAHPDDPRLAAVRAVLAASSAR
jgi:predicted CXXCH cytochrome family protein